jgi:hypothetical protein
MDLWGNATVIFGFMDFYQSEIRLLSGLFYSQLEKSQT